MDSKKVSDLHAGDIILYPPHKDDVLANLIAQFTSGTVNHAAILYTAGGEDQKVIESVLEGVRFNPIRPTSDEYRAKVMRIKKDKNLQPVLDAAQKCMDNKYPFMALGLLAILLLFGKRKPTMENKFLYSAMEYVTLGLMLVNQRIAGKGKKIMTCSQFTAQAFSDAGEEYSLHFNHLLIDDFLDKPTVLKGIKSSSLQGLGSVPLYEDVESSIYELENKGNKITENYVYEGLAQVSRDINRDSKTELEAISLQCMGSNKFSDFVDEKVSCNRLLAVLDKLITGNTGRKVQSIIKDFQSDAYRNFFVTPEDLFNGNCDSIEYIGEY